MRMTNLIQKPCADAFKRLSKVLGYTQLFQLTLLQRLPNLGLHFQPPPTGTCE